MRSTLIVALAGFAFQGANAWSRRNRNECVEPRDGEVDSWCMSDSNISWDDTAGCWHNWTDSEFNCKDFDCGPPCRLTRQEQEEQQSCDSWCMHDSNIAWDDAAGCWHNWTDSEFNCKDFDCPPPC